MLNTVFVHHVKTHWQWHAWELLCSGIFKEYFWTGNIVKQQCDEFKHVPLLTGDMQIKNRLEPSLMHDKYYKKPDFNCLSTFWYVVALHAFWTIFIFCTEVDFAHICGSILLANFSYLCKYAICWAYCNKCLKIQLFLLAKILLNLCFNCLFIA